MNSSIQSAILPLREARAVSSRLVAAVAAVVIALLTQTAGAQQRVILNKDFVQRATRAGVALPDYLGTTAQVGVNGTYCSGAGTSCLNYIGDARCLTPTTSPEQTRGCTVGWLTTDPFDGLRASVADGTVKAPVQIARGSAVEGLNLAGGGAELNAENAGRLFQNVCLAANESIPFSYVLGDPVSTGASASQARFGIFSNSGANAFTFPGTPVSVVDSTVLQGISAAQSGTVTAPATGGIYQIGFEAVQPPTGAVGNYISGVSITLTPLIDAGPSGTQDSTFYAPVGSSITRNLLVRVNGQVAAGGMTIPLTFAGTLPATGYQLGTPAAIDVDFNPVAGAHLTGSGANLLLFIPPGNYDANTHGNGSTSNPSGVVALPIIFVDDGQTAPSLNLSVTIGAPGSGGSTGGSGWGLADPRCDGTFRDTVTYTLEASPLPRLAKTFVPATIPYGGTTTMTFAIDNTGAGAAARPIAFTDNLATGLQVANPANATTTCGGTIGAAPAANQIVFSGGNIAVGASCTVSVDVTNRPGFSGLCYNPNFANENQNLVGLQNLIAQIEQYTCVSVTPPDCSDSATTNGFGNISGISPNLSNGVSGQCVAFGPTIQLIKISENATGSFGFTLGNTSATNPVTITTTAVGAPGTSSAVFGVTDIAQPLTVTESSLPANWLLTNMACQLADGTSIGSFDAPSATWTAAPAELADGQQITCTITNTANQFDFGDAPDSYGTLLASNGARHNIPGFDAAAQTAPLMLGSHISTEADGQPSSNASADSFDDGLVPGSVSLPAGATTASVAVMAVNAKATAATLAGWIDFNNNGVFDAGERAQVTVPANTTTATAFTLNWSGLAPIAPGFNSFARFRIATTASEVANPTGSASDGEVEDYAVPINNSATCDFAQNGSFEVPNIQGDPANPEPGTFYVNGWAVYRTSQSTIDGWQVTAGTVDILRYFTNASDGSQSIDLWGTAPATFEQTFTGLVPGQTYAFSVDYSGLSAANSRAGLYLDLGSGPQLLQTLSPSVDGVSNGNGGLPTTPSFTVVWQTYSHSFVATGTQATIRFVNQTAPATLNTGLFIDNFKFRSTSPCQDFGDAPDTYGTLLASNGARHVLAGYDAVGQTAPLMLGTRVDRDSDGFPSPGADGDDLNGVDDEDAFFGPIALQPGATTVSLDIPLTNTTGGNANVYAWIDFNGNGRFDVAEAGTCPVAAAAATSVTCTWTGLTALVDGFQTYARLRITTQTLAPGTAPNGGDARAQGSASDGEVEDHRVTVATVLPLTCEAPFVETFGTYAAAPGAFPGWGRALPAGTTTYVFQPGSAAPANTVNGGQYALLTNPRLSHIPWQNAPDHTPGDTDGFMLVVNGDPSPGVFYRHTFSGLAIGARYNFFASLANIAAGINAGLPNVRLRIVDPATSAVLASIDTGGIPEDPSGAMTWHQQQLIFTATQSVVRVELANNSGVQGGNDLALDDIGFAQVCELGDAPDTYGTLNASNGAGHLFPGPGLSLGGGLPDGELDGQPSVNADGDDLNGVDDENAFPSGAPQIVVAAPYALTVPVETTAGDATVCAWVDLDQNGSFSAAEGQCQSLAAGTTTASVSWPAAATAAMTSGRTYMRLRIERNGAYPANMSTADFIGARGAGEVEDYVVPVVTPANVVLVKSLVGESGSQPGIAEPGEQLTYAIVLTNSGQVAATAYGVTDTLDPNTTFVSADNGGAFAGGAVTWSGLTVPAGRTLTLSVAVTVNTPIPPGVAQLGNVAYQTGTAQPPCPPAGPACVITPTAAQVTTVKALSGESGTQPGVAEPGEQLTYTITLTNTGGSAATGYAESDRLDPNTTFLSASNGGVAAGGIVNWTGLTVPANGTLALTVVVTVNTPIPPGVTQLGNVAYQTGTAQPPCPPAGPACVITPTASHVTIGKVATTPAPTGTPNEYQISYTATVSNTGGGVGAYDLTDTLTFNGATVTAISAPVYASSTGDTQTGTLGSFAAPSGGTIVTGESINAQGTETWTYTVTYTITDAAAAQDCADPNGGLRNHAALGGSAAGAPAADTCSGAPNVNIVKTASAPVATGNPNEFTLTYTVNVSNSGTVTGVYTLADALSFNGATVSAITAPAYSSSTGDTQDGTLGSFTAPTGGTIVSGESIGAGGAETWIYTVTYTITNPTTAEDCADPAGGLRNDAALGGSLVGESTTCTGAPAVVIGKSASGPTPTGNPNEYTLVYLVTVQNNGTLAGLYDLDDTFTFPGVSNVSVSAVQHGGNDPLATPLGTLSATGGAIVTGETIAAGASETYTYSVVFIVDDATAVGNCALGGGLVNSAALGGSASGQVGTCSSVPDVAIAKSASGPTATGTPNQYTLTYTVTVSNNGGAEGTYDLADAFAFAGATVDAVSAVTHGGGDPLSSTLGALTASGGTIVTGETIAASASETYTYTVTFTLTDPATANDCTVPAGGLRNAATLGGSVSGEADTCSGVPVVALVKTLTGESGSEAGIAEPGETLTYTITLTNSGSVAAAAYGVTDPLDPNVTFVSASNGGVLAGGVVTWTNLTIPAGGTLALTVVVTVDNPLPSGAAAITNVAYPTGGTQPDCSATPAPPGCVVTPTEGTIAIAKSVVDANGNGLAEPGETLTYTITLTNTNGGDVTRYGVTDPLDANTTFVSADNGGVFAGGTVSWSGLTIPSGGTLSLTVVVTVNAPLPAGVGAIGNLAYQTGGTLPDCTTSPAPQNCTRLPTPAVVSLAKSVADANGDGEAQPGETLTYTITLTNTGGSAATNIPVTDPLDANTTFVSATNGGTFAAGSVTWAGLTVPANGTLNLTVVVTVHSPLPAGVTSIGNLVYQTGGTPPDCTALPLPANCTSIPTAPHVVISKTASTPVPTGNPNEYQLTYVATVHNDGGSGDAYTLADTLTFNGATVTAISAPLYASPNGQVQDGTLGSFTAPNGGTIVTGEDLGAGGIETWTYTVTYTLTDSATADNCTDPNGGLRNSAVASGNASGAAPAAATCTGAPSVSLLKTASAPLPTGNPNEFTLTYTVNVSNSGTLAGVYNLSDVLTFNGATISAISTPVYSSSSGDPQDGALGAFGLPDGGVIVTGESISAGGAQTWVYAVTYTITDATVAEDCATPAGGLRNRAALGGSLTGESTTCTGAPAVVIGKSASGPVPTGNPNEYRLTYLVRVQNNGSLVGTYDLADAFTFAGVSGISVSPVQHGGADPLATPLGTLTAAGGTIVTGETIAAGSSETYAYVVTFTIDDAIAVGTCAAGGGLTNQASLGGSSSGAVGTCSDVPSVAIAKTASAPTPTGTPNQYAITYTVTVDNAGAAAGSYDLSDAFTFTGATVGAVGAVTHAGPDPLATPLGTLTTAGGTIVTAETIAGASSESYSYTVTFTLTDPAAANDCTAPAGGLRNAASLGGSAVGEAATCTGAPSVTVTKALSSESGTQPGIAEPGETLTYTITLTNSGSTDAAAYGVSDPLDANVTFVSASNGGTAAGGTVTWSNLTVPANGTLALTVVVTVNTPIPAGVTAIGNLAFATGSTPPDCTAIPTPSACVITPTPGVVSIAKAVADANGNGLAEPGETLTYTITLSNTSGGDARNYGVTDPLDANTTFVSASNGGAFGAGTVTWSNLTIPAGQTLALTVVVTVSTPLPAGVTQIGNLAYQSGGTPPDCTALPLPANCTSIPVPAAGAITIVKTVADASGNGVAEPGETLTYTITLTNSGGQDVTGYGVTDPLDANTTFVSADNGGSAAANIVTWTGLTIPSGGSLALHVIVTVHSPLPAGVTQIGNSAYQTGGTPPDCTATPLPPGCAVILTPPTGAPMLSIAKTLSTPALRPGGMAVYTLTVSNVGTAAATHVMIDDPIAPGLTGYAWTCAASGGASCANASGSGAISEMIAMFPAGGVLVYRVTATVDANPPARIVNTASVTPSGSGTCAPSGTPSPCAATAVGTVTQAPPAIPTPATDVWALLLLGLGLLGLTWRVGRRVI